MKNNYISGGIGFCGLLTIAFIVLKLCNVINWSWIWIISPVWIPLGIGVAFIIILFIALGIQYIQMNLISKKFKKRRGK